VIGIVAMNGDGCIGRAGTIPWHHREDLQFFKRTTAGGTIVMGRKTWDSLPRRPLPRRTNVVLTRTVPASRPAGATFCRMDELDGVLRDAPAPVFVIGGAAIYDALWDRIGTFLVTRVPDVVPDGDTWFPRPLEPEFTLEETTALTDALTVERWVRSRG
jgi:dihydrofolate reductase